MRNLDTITGDPTGDDEVAPARASITKAGARRVFVQGLELVGSIGIYEHERRYNQRIVVSVDLAVTDLYDGTSDDIRAVYDYDRAIGAVKALVERRHYNLIETLAERIAEACLADEQVSRATVRIEKPDVLPGCRAVGIEIERARG